MTSRIIRLLAPPVAAILGIGIGYISAGQDEAVPQVAVAHTGQKPAEAPKVLEIPYPATMDGLIRATAENTSARREWLLDSLTAKMTVAELQATAMRIETLVRDEQYVLLQRVIAAWAVLDPDGAEGWLIQHAPTFRKGASTFLAALEAYAKKQPVRAFAILDRLPAGERREKLAATAATELAKLNPRQAEELAKSVTDEKARKLAVVGVLAGLAHADPLAALARTGDMPEERRRSLVATALDRLFARDAVVGFAEFAKLSPQEQNQHIYTLSWRYAERAPEAFADYVEKNAESEDYSRVSSAASYAAAALAANDPVRAMEWAKSLPVVAQSEAVDSALSAWSKKDPMSAMAWALKNKPVVPAAEAGDDSEDTSAILRAIRRYGGNVNAFLNEQPGNENRRIITVLNEWSSADPAAVDAWSKTAEGSPYRQEVAAALFSTVISEGRVEDARELLSQIPADRQNSIIWGAVSSITDSNPAQAAEWLTKLPMDETSTTLYESVAQEWSDKDIVAVASWIEKLPKSPARDAAARAYAQRISGADPTAAMEWTLGTTAGDERSSSLATIYAQWQRKHPAAAAGWLQSVEGLSAAEREYLSSFER